MASSDLTRLYKLHQVDAAILEVRKTAANMDGGKKLTAELEQLNTTAKPILDEAKQLHVEQTDLEQANEAIETKLKKIDKEMYGGSVVNSREVANLEKEMANLKQTRSKNEDRLLELMDLVPPAKMKAAKYERAIATKKQEILKWREEAMKNKGVLETRFKELSAQRPEIAKTVSPALLARYDMIRTSHGGVGMAPVTSKMTCGECGTAQPERTLQLLGDDKLVLCEACKRILFYNPAIF